MRREFLPIAVGFWGVAIPLGLSVLLYCRTPVERVAVGLASVLFFTLGILISRART